MNKKQLLSPKDQRRFLDNIDSGDREDCWSWQGGIQRRPNGEEYPIFYFNGTQKPAHRILWRVYYSNYLRKDEVIQHTCDHSWCMNPNHIYKVDRELDAREHAKERVRRRQGYGENHPKARLSDQEIAEIRHRVKNGELRKDVAADFGISKSYVSMLVKRKRRRSV